MKQADEEKHLPLLEHVPDEVQMNLKYTMNDPRTWVEGAGWTHYRDAFTIILVQGVDHQ